MITQRIWIDARGHLSTLDCSNYHFDKRLRAFAQSLRASADRCGGARFFAIEGDIVRAASEHYESVLPFITPDRVLVHCHK